MPMREREKERKKTHQTFCKTNQLFKRVMEEGSESDPERELALSIIIYNSPLPTGLIHSRRNEKKK